MRNIKLLPAIIIVAINLGGLFKADPSSAAGLVVDHTFPGFWQSIPDSIITRIINNNRIYYVHTSHGGQLNSDATEVNQADSRFPDINYYPYQIINNIGDDLGYAGDTSWAGPTRTYLNAHAEYNIAMYSWCAGVSSQTEAAINIYLAKMTELEGQYPNVTFIYMTGHLDGTGPTGNLYVRNNQIRQYCAANDEVLYDFADIESWDQDGNYYPDESDACAWCSDWCDAPEHDCDLDCSCEHSHCFNCFQKSKAWWVMMARLEGWVPVGIDDNDVGLPEKYMLKQNQPNPFNTATMIKYDLPEASRVTIEIYDPTSRLVETLINEIQPVGSH